jgi:hypothetical protein
MNMDQDRLEFETDKVALESRKGFTLSADDESLKHDVDMSTLVGFQDYDERLEDDVLFNPGNGNLISHENLPSIEWLKKEGAWIPTNVYNWSILSSERLTSLIELWEKYDLKEGIEVFAGNGYLSGWMRRAGLPIIATTDAIAVKKNFQLKIVEKKGALDTYIKFKDRAQTLVVSYPPASDNNDADAMIELWNSLEAGSKLVYLGGTMTSSLAFYEKIKKEGILITGIGGGFEDNSLLDEVIDAFKIKNDHDVPLYFNYLIEKR